MILFIQPVPGCVRPENLVLLKPNPYRVEKQKSIYFELIDNERESCTDSILVENVNKSQTESGTGSIIREILILFYSTRTGLWFPLQSLLLL